MWIKERWRNITNTTNHIGRSPGSVTSAIPRWSSPGSTRTLSVYHCRPCCRCLKSCSRISGNFCVSADFNSWSHLCSHLQRPQKYPTVQIKSLPCDRPMGLFQETMASLSRFLTSLQTTVSCSVELRNITPTLACRFLSPISQVLRSVHRDHHLLHPSCNSQDKAR